MKVRIDSKFMGKIFGLVYHQIFTSHRYIFKYLKDGYSTNRDLCGAKVSVGLLFTELV